MGFCIQADLDSDHALIGLYEDHKGQLVANFTH